MVGDEGAESLWDQEIAAADGASITQTAFFARLRGRVDAAQPVFLVCEDDAGNRLGWLQVLKDIPGARWQSAGLRHQAEYLLNRWCGGRLFWSGGPALIPGVCQEKVIAALLDCVDGLATAMGTGSIGTVHLSPSATFGGALHTSDIFTTRGYRSRTWATLLVPLTDEGAAWTGLNRGARKSVNKAERMGVHVQEIETIEQFRTDFYDPYCEAEAAFGRAVNPWFVLQSLFEEDRDKRYVFFVARHEGEVMGTLGVHNFAGRAGEIASTLTPLAMERKVPAQDKLHWHALQWAVRSGCATFDLAGINPNPTNDKESGIRKFKEKWGGNYVEYNLFDKPVGWLARGSGLMKRWVR